jgi:hypothetical protein
MNNYNKLTPRDFSIARTAAIALGDGKEADCETNRPHDQTDPALFAAPHFFRPSHGRKRTRFDTNALLSK